MQLPFTPHSLIIRFRTMHLWHKKFNLEALLKKKNYISCRSCVGGAEFKCALFALMHKQCLFPGLVLKVSFLHDPASLVD